jgi:hypothetical protein
MSKSYKQVFFNIYMSSKDYSYTTIYKVQAPNNNDVYIWFSNRKDRRYFQGVKNINGRKYLHPRLSDLINDFYMEVKFIKKFPCKGIKEVQKEIEKILVDYPNNINHLAKVRLGRKKNI